tara:strand:+ start:1442 stop:2059 length:618 start_codon:yes stop_codon:yes gene_type:complete
MKITSYYIFKKILFTLIIILNLQSFSKADDISDFEIEGMSIGDSLLNYFSEDEIKENEKRAYVQKNKFIINGFYKHPNFQIYDNVQVTYKKKDKKYLLYALEGKIYYKENIQECYLKKDLIVEDISEALKDVAKKFDAGGKKHEADKSGNSKSTVVEFWFENGDLARVICTDWSKELENKNYWDDLSVILNDKEYANFLMYEAYK